MQAIHVFLLFRGPDMDQFSSNPLGPLSGYFDLSELARALWLRHEKVLWPPLSQYVAP